MTLLRSLSLLVDAKDHVLAVEDRFASMSVHQQPTSTGATAS